MTSDNKKSSLDSEIEAALDGLDLQSLGAETHRPNERLLSGTIVGITGDDVFVDLGPRSQGVIQSVEFDEPPEVGQSFKFTMCGRDDDLILLSRREARALAAWDEIEIGSIVEARVEGVNKGGLELKVGPLGAFMPASHCALRHVDDLMAFGGQKLTCEVLEIDRGKKRILLSRRNVLRQEADAARDALVGTLQPGATVRGKVTRVEPFGAFVDIGGGVEGLVHVSNISRQRVEDPNEVLKKGQEVEAQILDIKEGGRRIGLGMKQLEPDPWDSMEERFPEESIVKGKVTRLMDFGAFCELEPGLEGLLHVSQIATHRLRRPSEAVSVGEELSVRVVSVDRMQRRIALSRMDRRGAILGSEEAVDDAEIKRIIAPEQSGPLGTNLGDLFRKALDK